MRFKPSMHSVLSVSVACAIAALCGTAAYVVGRSDPVEVLNYQQVYGVGRSAAVALERIDRYSLSGLWVDSRGVPWVTYYTQFAPGSRERTLVGQYACNAALTFWPRGSGPNPGQRQVLMDLATDLLLTPEPGDEATWASVSVVGMLGLRDDPQFKDLIEAACRDAETRHWADRFR